MSFGRNTFLMDNVTVINVDMGKLSLLVLLTATMTCMECVCSPKCLRLITGKGNCCNNSQAVDICEKHDSNMLHPLDLESQKLGQIIQKWLGSSQKSRKNHQKEIWVDTTKRANTVFFKHCNHSTLDNTHYRQNSNKSEIKQCYTLKESKDGSSNRGFCLRRRHCSRKLKTLICSQKCSKKEELDNGSGDFLGPRAEAVMSEDTIRVISTGDWQVEPSNLDYAINEDKRERKGEDNKDNDEKEKNDSNKDLEEKKDEKVKGKEAVKSDGSKSTNVSSDNVRSSDSNNIRSGNINTSRSSSSVHTKDNGTKNNNGRNNDKNDVESDDKSKKDNSDNSRIRINNGSNNDNDTSTKNATGDHENNDNFDSNKSNEKSTNSSTNIKSNLENDDFINDFIKNDSKDDSEISRNQRENRLEPTQVVVGSSSHVLNDHSPVDETQQVVVGLHELSVDTDDLTETVEKFVENVDSPKRAYAIPVWLISQRHVLQMKPGKWREPQQQQTEFDFRHVGQVVRVKGDNILVMDEQSHPTQNQGTTNAPMTQNDGLNQPITLQSDHSVHPFNTPTPANTLATTVTVGNREPLITASSNSIPMANQQSESVNPYLPTNHHPLIDANTSPRPATVTEIFRPNEAIFRPNETKITSPARFVTRVPPRCLNRSCPLFRKMTEPPQHPTPVRHYAPLLEEKRRK